MQEHDEKATRGPWETCAGDGELLTGYELPTPVGKNLKHTIQLGYPGGSENTRMIAFYRTAAPLLAEIVEKLMKQRDDEIWDTEGDGIKEKYNAELDAIVAKGMGEK